MRREPLRANSFLLPLASAFVFSLTLNNTLCAKASLLVLSLSHPPSISGETAEKRTKKSSPQQCHPPHSRPPHFLSAGKQRANAFWKCPSMKTLLNCLVCVGLCLHEGVCVCVHVCVDLPVCLLAWLHLRVGMGRWTSEDEKIKREMGLFPGGGGS